MLRRLGLTQSVLAIELTLFLAALVWYLSLFVLFASSGKKCLDKLPLPFLFVLTVAPLLSLALSWMLHRALRSLDRSMRLHEILLIVFVASQFLGADYVWLGVLHYL
jgi:hypothetical protein